jgi:two-component system, response regulator FlrC
VPAGGSAGAASGLLERDVMLDPHLSSVSRTPATVLIVEDDDDLRELLVDTLRRDGFVVLDASSVREAAEILDTPDGKRRRHVDLVLSDVRMDGLSGIDLGRLLRSTRETTPLILMTAFPEPCLHVEAANMGATVLPKPFRLEVLRRAVLTTIADYVKQGREAS